jgi:hypothetical protein
MYCYSFEPYPWTQHYSQQPEILEYLHHCAGAWNASADISTLCTAMLTQCCALMNEGLSTLHVL